MDTREGKHMSSYIMDPPGASQAIDQLRDIIEDLKGQFGGLYNIVDELLSDNNWRGPNKQDYRKDFGAYLESGANLLKNGVEHFDALQGIANSYLENEG